MNRATGLVLLLLFSVPPSSALLFGQRGPGGTRGVATSTQRVVPRANGGSCNGCSSTPFVYSYFYPPFGWYGGYASPFLTLPFYTPPQTYLPNYWWTGPYPPADPRQEGYNPSSGYPPDTVATLLLQTFPAKAGITLDGVYVGTADSLGPTQLPMGEHTLRVEASSYEASETVLKIEQPGLRQLEVRLKPIVHAPKPGPQR